MRPLRTNIDNDKMQYKVLEYVKSDLSLNDFLIEHNIDRNDFNYHFRAYTKYKVIEYLKIRETVKLSTFLKDSKIRKQNFNFHYQRIKKQTI